MLPFDYINADTIEGLTLQSSDPLKVIIHGYNSSHSGTPNLELVPQFLQIPNISIISVDYSNLVPDPCYTQSVHNAHVVGRCIGYFLFPILNSNATVTEKLHLIGFGLGAHVASFAANYLSDLGLKVPHITALDPAKPLYVTTDLAERLDPSDADFIDVIHTDIFIYGLMQPVGHVDFFPNKGVVQPNCGPIDDIDTHHCYHVRAVEYYAESISSSEVFWAFRCRDLYGFIVGECEPNNDVEQMGYFVRETARGNYFLMTNGKPPYCKGKDFSNLDRTLYGETYLGDALVSKLKELGPSLRVLTTDIRK
ncbi:pancreatic triacylglycerol lipase-like isoform X2 [Drosophila innubila]|uniref:pancreatic triacylglycerol lipase-like isoform X2 n=1 Tax=Drosophila innubila TaxID=198719 RepID=UPI00148DCA43|nr:pancreatic triacylglycerol lipase-like isoform X2 [Drosophila innubila]